MVYYYYNFNVNECVFRDKKYFKNEGGATVNAGQLPEVVAACHQYNGKSFFL